MPSEGYSRIVQLLPILNDTMISKEVNLSREYVRQVRNEHGIASPLKRKRCSLVWNEEKLAMLCKLDITKCTRQEIATLIEVSREQLHLKCKEIGIDLSFCLVAFKYSDKILLELYEKHDGNIRNIGKEYVEKGLYITLNAATSSFARRYKRLGLKGRGEIYGGDIGREKSRAKITKYTYENMKPLWDRNGGNVSAITRELGLRSNSNIWRVCKRLGFIK